MSRSSKSSAALLDVELVGLSRKAQWREWMGRVEAVIFASPTPVPREMLATLVGPNCHLDDLIADIQNELLERPYELVFVAGGWHHRTRHRYADAIHFARQPQTGSAERDLNSTERLVVTAIAYLQPVTRKELSRLFGKEVNRDIIARLKRLDFIGAGPRSPEPGAPLTYVTTAKFLSVFGFASLRDLPDIEALEEAGLLQPFSDANEPVEALDRELGLMGDDKDEAQPDLL